MLRVRDDHAGERRAPVVRTLLSASNSSVVSVHDGLSLSREPIGVLKDMSWLGRWTLGLSLSLRGPLLLLDRRFIGLSRALKDCGLLRRLSVDRLPR